MDCNCTHHILITHPIGMESSPVQQSPSLHDSLTAFSGTHSPSAGQLPTTARAWPYLRCLFTLKQTLAAEASQRTETDPFREEAAAGLMRVMLNMMVDMEVAVAETVSTESAARSSSLTKGRIWWGCTPDLLHQSPTELTLLG